MIAAISSNVSNEKPRIAHSEQMKEHKTAENNIMLSFEAMYQRKKLDYRMGAIPFQWENTFLQMLKSPTNQRF